MGSYITGWFGVRGDSQATILWIGSCAPAGITHVQPCHPHFFQNRQAIGSRRHYAHRVTMHTPVHILFVVLSAILCVTAQAHPPVLRCQASGPLSRAPSKAVLRPALHAAALKPQPPESRESILKLLVSREETKEAKIGNSLFPDQPSPTSPLRGTPSLGMRLESVVSAERKSRWDQPPSMPQYAVPRD